MYADHLSLYAPPLLFHELEKNKKIIEEKSGFTEQELDALIELLKLRITIIPLEDLLPVLDEAEAISPSQKDMLYIAAALKQNCSLWSGDILFKQQNKVTIFNTKELIEKGYI